MDENRTEGRNSLQVEMACMYLDRKAMTMTTSVDIITRISRA